MTGNELESYSVASIVNLVARQKDLRGHAPTWTARDGALFLAVRALCDDHGANQFHASEIATEDAPDALDAPLPEKSANVIEMEKAA